MVKGRWRRYRVRMLALMPSEVDPHHYEQPAQEVITLLKDAKVVFMTGPSHLPIEMKLRGFITSVFTVGFY
ncbi:MAG: hypothetical protein QXS62_04195 [Sulfolobales archaeon]